MIRNLIYFTFNSISGGDTRSRLAENLDPAGTYLIMKNYGTLAALVGLWVEQLSFLK